MRKFDGRKYDYLPRYPQEEIYVRLSPSSIEALRNRIVIDALTGLNTVLGSFHDRRKTVVMVSEGMASFLPPGAYRRGHIGSAPTFNERAANTGAISTLDQLSSLLDLQNRMKDILTAAARSNTSVYAWDPRGLAASEFDRLDVDITTDWRFLRERTDSLRLIAEETGGRAGINTNDPTPLLREMLIDSSAYYLLGYTPTAAPHDGKFHEIAVRVKRKGIEVRARKGYWALSLEDVARADRPAGPPLPIEVAEALATAATPSTGHLVRTWVGFDHRDSGQTAVSIVWEAAADQLPAEPVHHANVIVSSSNGEPVFRGKSMTDPSATAAAGRVTFTTRPGLIRVRVSAEDASGRSVDSEDRDVVVPDFTTVGLMVTPPEIFRARTLWGFTIGR